MSELEDRLETRMRQLGLPPMEREYRFHPHRKWLFDFADPESMIAVEVEGGEWARGRHVRGSGFIKDCEKYNEAARLGWRVFRFPGSTVKDDSAALYMEGVYHDER